MNQYDRVKEELRRSPKTWLVTGVAGFIGSHLLQELLELGQQVVGLDNFSTGYQRNIAEVQKRHSRQPFRFVEGDIRSLATCADVMRGVDYVLHEAADASVPRSIDNPLMANEVNVVGTLNLLTAARDAGVRRFVFASSSAVYGDADALPLREADAGSPLSPYAVSKWTDEKYAEVFSRAFGLETIGLRYFNVFGPRQDPNGSYAAVIPKWIDTMLSGSRCVVNGDGETTRDFCPVQDVVQANILAATAPFDRGAHRVYNVGAGRRTSLNELHDMLAAALPRVLPSQTIQPRLHQDFRAGDVRHSQADIAGVVADLGYTPTQDLRRALEETMQWYTMQWNVNRVLARTA